MIKNPEPLLITAGGKITCRRCKAQSSRSKLQCMKPALKGKAVCGHHGGLSTGPKTRAGIERIRAAHLTHGEDTLEARAERSQTLMRIAMLEQMGWHLKMFSGNKVRGRKPTGYVKLDLNQPEQMVLAIKLSSDN